MKHLWCTKLPPIALCYLFALSMPFTPLLANQSPEELIHTKPLEKPRTLDSQELRSKWQTLRDHLRDLHHSKEMRELATTKDQDILIAKDLYFIGRMTSAGLIQHFHLILGDLVYNRDGLKLRSPDGQKPYYTPRFAKGLLCHDWWGKMYEDQKVKLVEALAGRDLIHDVRKQLETASSKK